MIVFCLRWRHQSNQDTALRKCEYLSVLKSESLSLTADVPSFAKMPERASEAVEIRKPFRPQEIISCEVDIKQSGSVYSVGRWKRKCREVNESEIHMKSARDVDYHSRR